MDYEHIRLCMAECRFTDHARREMENEPFGVIRVDEVLEALRTGEIIEEYPHDQPYEPDPARWDEGFRRRRAS